MSKKTYSADGLFKRNRVIDEAKYNNIELTTEQIEEATDRLIKANPFRNTILDIIKEVYNEKR